MQYKKIAVLLFMTVVLSLPGNLLADWVPGMPYKWLQMPDLSPMGMDVNATDRIPPGLPPDDLPRVLADDFSCTATGLITDIHIWGSWKNDLLPFNSDPKGVAFRLAIYSDIPAKENSQGLWSKPGNLLWEQTFNPTDYVARPWQTGLVEGWYDPATGTYLPVGDTVCWQYNFDIPPAIAFLQEGTPNAPKVYWLAVDAIVLDTDQSVEFGWKTSITHWNDDATWQLDNPNMIWNEMRYPIQHPLQGQSVDLAFVITPEPGTIALLGFGAAYLIRRRRM